MKGMGVRMKITNMRVNHIINPVGYDVVCQTFSWNYEEDNRSMKKLLECRVEIAGDGQFKEPVHDSGFRTDISNISYELAMDLEPCTRYYWKVTARDSEGEAYQSGIAFFETGKCDGSWSAKWISIRDGKKASPIVRKAFVITKPVKRVRGYMTGLGLYECYVNGKLVNDGFLQPGFHNYRHWVQYQTYDLTGAVQKGENVLGFLLGAGWYKGRFGVNGGFEDNFGENYQLLCEISIEYQDGSQETIGSDQSFVYEEGPVISSNIYDGEIYDRTKEPEGWQLAGFDASAWKHVEEKEPENIGSLSERYSIPIVCKERRKNLKVLRGSGGELILDLGQNISGWIVFKDKLKKGERLLLKHVELLEDGNICQKNLLGAKQEFEYISDGRGRMVRPHFTYYGFQYVQVEGWPEAERLIAASSEVAGFEATGLESADVEDFEAWVLYSDLDTTGSIITGNAKVNQFISNAYWSQRDNFVDHPTDCPQRSERLGWTGDAQMYCSTACLTMYTPAFYRKYMKDVNEEQKRLEGLVPFIVPRIRGRGMEEKPENDMTSAAWSDVATILPWTMYLYYGDRNLLREEYPGMKAWVDSVIQKDLANGDKKLWQCGFHFGDWLALDNPEPGPFGLTDSFYIASCYYFYSTKLLSKAARVLGLTEDEKFYGGRAEQIREELVREYFGEDGICKIDTQTAYVLAIYFDIVSEEAIAKNGQKLVGKIEKNGGHLDTGFVGTVYLCQALSKAGFSEAAYDLLLKEDYPSWLYQVNMGATTVWESWNALDGTGRLSAESSLNHYAFGSIVEWLYRDVCGINPMEEYPGFRKVLLQPKPSRKLGEAKASVLAPTGYYKSEWKFVSEHTVKILVSVPFSGAAILQLPDGSGMRELEAGDYEYEVCLA